MQVEDELDFLAAVAAEHGQAGPESLGAAVRLVAYLGGRQERKHDSHGLRLVPGTAAVRMAGLKGSWRCHLSSPVARGPGRYYTMVEGQTREQSTEPHGRLGIRRTRSTRPESR